MDEVTVVSVSKVTITVPAPQEGMTWKVVPLTPLTLDQEMERDRMKQTAREINDMIMAGLQLPKELVTGENASYASSIVAEQQW